MMRACLLCAISALVLAAPAGIVQATPITLQFDPSEVGAATPQPVDGQSVLGIDFGFTIGGAPAPSGASYGATGPDSFAVTFLDPPVLEGDPAGVLSLLFDAPTTQLGFSLAFPLIGGIGPAAHIELFEGVLSIASLVVSTLTEAGGIWSEAEFLWLDPAAQVTQAVITFDQTNVIDDPFITVFWLDNLSHSPPEPLPEPGTFLLLVVGLFGSLAHQRRRSREPGPRG